MITEQINKADNDRLHQLLENLLRGLRQKNVNYQINVHDVNIAIIVVTVSGRRGTITRNVILMNDNLDGWVVYSNTHKHITNSLSELTTIMRSLIQKLSTIVNKF